MNRETRNKIHLIMDGIYQLDATCGAAATVIDSINVGEDMIVRSRLINKTETSNKELRTLIDKCCVELLNLSYDDRAEVVNRYHHRRRMVKATGTSSMPEHLYCKDCGWPVVDSVCTDEFEDFKDATEWDWWYYCSNKGCENHDGEGVFQDTPDWLGGAHVR